MLDVFKRIFYNKNNIYDVESTVARVNFYWFVKIRYFREIWMLLLAKSLGLVSKSSLSL